MGVFIVLVLAIDLYLRRIKIRIQSRAARKTELDEIEDSGCHDTDTFFELTEDPLNRV